MADPQKIHSPSLSMPAGGGALRGIGEPFKAQQFTGAAGFSIPLPLPSARGLAPQLGLAYNSGNGNGSFGLGFSLSVDAIAVKTQDGIPTYGAESAYILSSAGELIPALSSDEKGGGTPQIQSWISPEGIAWTIATYVPRIQNEFDKIEQWRNDVTQEVHWRVVTNDNTTHLYGNSCDSRIFDPLQPLHVFEWLLAESADAHGNRILYEYRPEDQIGIPNTIYNAGRDRSTQRYLWRIQYGNYALGEFTPIDPIQPQEGEAYAYRILLDYGQIDPENPNAPFGDWECRPDPFSSYKAGFEIRTYRRCRGIYLQHFLWTNSRERHL